MRTWEYEDYVVKEKEFDYDLHEFDVVKNGEIVATITPGSIHNMEGVIYFLNQGYCVDGWEDGKGNTINI